MKELSKRILSGIIGLVLLIVVISKGGYFLSLSVYLISLIGLREFYKAIERNKFNPICELGYIWTTGLFINSLYTFNYLEILLTLITIILLVLTVIQKNITIEDVSMTILGMIYIPFFLFYVVRLDGSVYTWLIFIIAFGTDTFAYIAGNLFGKKKLCPEISPNKTIAGAIGGIIGSIILTIIFSIYFQPYNIVKMIILSIICSILSQLGDLTASKIKRATGIKDYGFIMPGHGGVLDRFDSIIFTAPVVYYYIGYFLN